MHNAKRVLYRVWTATARSRAEFLGLTAHVATISIAETAQYKIFSACKVLEIIIIDAGAVSSIRWERNTLQGNNWDEMAIPPQFDPFIGDLAANNQPVNWLLFFLTSFQWYFLSNYSWLSRKTLPTAILLSKGKRTILMPQEPVTR